MMRSIELYGRKVIPLVRDLRIAERDAVECKRNERGRPGTMPGRKNGHHLIINLAVFLLLGVLVPRSAEEEARLAALFETDDEPPGKAAEALA